MRLPPIGRMRHRMTIEYASRNPDGGGGADETWTTLAEVWADLRPLSGGERLAADGLAGTISHEITMRYRADVRPSMRFRFGSRIFEISAVIDLDERRRRQRCQCTEHDL